MSQVFAYVGIVILLFAASAPVSGRGQVRQPNIEVGPIVADNPRLRDSVDRLTRGSALWRNALESAKQRGRRAVILTPDQVVVTTGDQHGSVKAFDAGVLAEVTPVTRGTSRVDAVLIVVNLPLVERLHTRRNSLPAEFETDLDRILAHEVYGHALPYLLAGDLSGHCPDPVLNQPAAEACAIRRENAVRAELGLGRRVDAGLSSLTLAWN
ncbi:MAG: hypothetical protein ABL961_04760 [Vicinamibacterales bacterium]